MYAETVSPRRAVFIDARVPDLRTLLDGARPGHDVFVLDPDRDGLAQIASILGAERRDGLSEIHVVSHGAPGRVQLGAVWLDADGLGAQAGPLAAIGAALAPGGSLRLYGCAVAAGPAGRHFLDALSLALGGADVAASARPTGSGAFGGDWDLEVGTGPVAAGLPFAPEALAAYRGVLGFLNGEQRVNQTQGPNAQSDGVITRLSNGTYVVVWMDNRDTDRTFDFDYYGRFLDANGNPTGNEFLVAKDTTTLVDPNYDGNDYSYYNDHNVLALPPGSDPNLPNGGFVVIGSRFAFDKNNTLANTGNPHLEFEIVGRYFTNSGTPVGSEFVISTSAGPNTTQRSPSSVVFDDGSFVVTWFNANSTSANVGEITGQRFNAQHQPVGGKFQINSTAANTQEQVDIAALTDGAGHTNGKFVTVWTSRTASNTDFNQTDSEIYARVFNADGSQAVAEFRVNANTNLHQDAPSVAALANGGFVVVYKSEQTINTGNYDLYFRAFDANGVQTIAETRINDDSVKTQDPGNVQALPDGGFLVTWSESNNDGNDDVRGQRYDASGAQVGSEFTVNQTTMGNQTQTYDGKDPVEIRYDAGQTSQQAVITWHGGTTQGSVNDTFARTLEMHTAPSGTNNSKTILANQTYTFQASDFGFTDQFDGAGDTFTSVIITSLPSAGSLTFNNVAVTQGQSIPVSNIGQLRYIPAANGNDGSFTFQVKDNGDTSVASDDTDRSPNTFSFDNSLPNAAPTGIALGPSTVAENAANGTLVGTLSVTDPDGPGASYTLVNSAGGRFQLIGNQILVADGLLLDFEQNASHTVRVAVDDGAGGLYQQDILITLGNVTPESVLGDGRGNVIVAGTGNDALYGKGGDDDLTGGGGIDLLDGGTGADTLRGGAGNDVYGIDDIGDTIDEAAGAGSGLDTIKALIDIDLADYANVENVKLFGSGTIAATGSGAANVLDGSLNAAANTLTGLGGDDVYVIGANDIIVEADGGGFDTVKATASSADISGFDFVEGVKLAGALAIDATGNSGANTLIGNGAANTLSGLGGNDTLSGGAGTDILIGGAGSDKLSGGADNDTFRFVEAADSPFAGADKILDFAAGDTIDVSGVDADGDAGNGDQAFVLDALGDNSFAAGHIRQTVAKSGTALYLDFNTDADSAAEMRIIVVGRTTALSASDFDL